MTPQQLFDYVQTTPLSHIYQPVLIRTLVDAGGEATVRELAVAQLQEDEAIIRTMEERLKRMPLPVLRKNGVITVDRDVVRLTTAGVTDVTVRTRLRAACEARLRSYLGKHAPRLWEARAGRVPSATAWAVLEAANLRCARCNHRDRPLEVDHIQPRSLGGTNDLWNLQCLCSECNRQKGNREIRDYRAEGHPHRRFVNRSPL